MRLDSEHEGACRMKKVLALLLIYSILSPLDFGMPSQKDTGSPTPDISAKDAAAEKIRHRVERLGVGERITLIMLNGQEYYGTIAQVGSSEIQIVEVDLKQIISIHYDQLKKVRKGYGRMNTITGRRVNPRVNRVIFFAFLGFLFGMTALVASSD
jgi:hypothetical protein